MHIQNVYSLSGKALSFRQNSQIDARTYKPKRRVAALWGLCSVKNWTMIPENTDRKKRKKKE